MTRIHLVRHGRASAGWDSDPDPGLDAVGRHQATTAADLLAPLGPMRLISSPLRRCQETAEPLGSRWGIEVEVVPAVAEIPSPEGVAMQDCVEWLRLAMRGGWTDLGGRYTEFRDGVVAAIAGMPADAVVFSHFIAINAVIGAALGDDRLVIRSLDNCSITIIEVTGGALRLVEGGHEADTLIR